MNKSHRRILRALEKAHFQSVQRQLERDSISDLLDDPEDPDEALSDHHLRETLRASETSRWVN